MLAMYRARELDPREAPGLHARVGELAERAGLPTRLTSWLPQ